MMMIVQKPNNTFIRQDITVCTRLRQGRLLAGAVGVRKINGIENKIGHGEDTSYYRT